MNNATDSTSRNRQRPDVDDATARAAAARAKQAGARRRSASGEQRAALDRAGRVATTVQE